MASFFFFFSIRIFSSRIELQRRAMAMKFSQSHAGSRNLQHITLKKKLTRTHTYKKTRLKPVNVSNLEGRG